MGGACSMHRRGENAYIIFVGKRGGKKPLGIGWEGVVWIHLA
jgi:hypothetical protein